MDNKKIMDYETSVKLIRVKCLKKGEVSHFIEIVRLDALLNTLNSKFTDLSSIPSDEL